MKILGVKCWRITDAEYDSTLRILDGWWHRWRSIHCYLTFNRWNDERNVNCNRNDNDWNDNWFLSGVPTPRNSLHFSPEPLCSGEFCLTSCPFHPPSILPTSSSGIERAMYFFVSSDLVSQRMSKNIFSVSSLRIARRTHGCFSVFERKLALATASINATNSASTVPPSVCRWVFGMV